MLQKISRQILFELLWLIVSLALTALLAISLFGASSLVDTLDIHIHDTYIVITPFYLLLPMFLMVTFVIYFSKEFRRSFNRTLSNWILIITGFILVIALTFLTKAFSQFVTGGWTAYPPLSALESDNVIPTQDPVTKIITNFFALLQIVILTMLLYVSYRWGCKSKAR